MQDLILDIQKADANTTDRKELIDYLRRDHRRRKQKGIARQTRNTKIPNRGHENITAAINIKCYFAHPYASWERGTNEHVNGLVR